MLGSTTAENLACTDEVKVYEDEGEEEEQQKSSENLTEDKVRLVIEGETQIPKLFDLFGGKNGTAPLFKMPFPTDPRLASYFLPGYPAAIAAAMAAVNAAAAASNSTQGIASTTNTSSLSPTSPRCAGNGGSTTPGPPSSLWPYGSTTSRTFSFWSNPSAAVAAHVPPPLPQSRSFAAMLGGTGSSSCSSSSSSGYASSDGSAVTATTSTAASGTASNWFQSAVPPGALNLSNYPLGGGYHNNNNKQAAAGALLGSRMSHGGARGCTEPWSDTAEQGVGSDRHRTGSAHPYMTNPFGLMPFYDPFAAAAAAAAMAAAYSPQTSSSMPVASTNTTNGPTVQQQHRSSGIVTTSAMRSTTPRRLHNGQHLLDVKQEEHREDGEQRLTRWMNNAGADLSTHAHSTRTPAVDSTSARLPYRSPTGSHVDVMESVNSPQGPDAPSSHRGTSKGMVDSGSPVVTRSGSTNSCAVPSPGSTRNTQTSDLYAAAACAAAMAAAVASWSGSANSPRTSLPGSCQRSPATGPQTLLPASPAATGGCGVSTPSNAAMRSRNGSGCSMSTTARSPLLLPSSLMPGSPQTPSLAAAVAAALSPATAAAAAAVALYQRRDQSVSSRVSSSNNSAVASPYSPSMFAAAAAAHMQLLSAAALTSSCARTNSDTTSSSTATTPFNPRLASPSSTGHLMSEQIDQQQPASRTNGSSNWMARPTVQYANGNSNNNSGPVASPGFQHRIPSPSSAEWLRSRRGGAFPTRGRGARRSMASHTMLSKAAHSNRLVHKTKLEQAGENDGDNHNHHQQHPEDRGSGRVSLMGRSGKRGVSHSTTTSTAAAGCYGTTKPSTHIKKPLNAFMLFMKEMRARVQEECTLKESAAINQVLGKKWHELTRDEQTKYYEMARREKELHQQLYPNWSARDNYAYHARRRKRRRHLLHHHYHTLHTRGRHPSRLAMTHRLGSQDASQSSSKLAEKEETEEDPSYLSGSLFHGSDRSSSGSPLPIGGRSLSPLSSRSGYRHQSLPHTQYSSTVLDTASGPPSPALTSRGSTRRSPPTPTSVENQRHHLSQQLQQQQSKFDMVLQMAAMRKSDEELGSISNLSRHPTTETLATESRSALRETQHSVSPSTTKQHPASRVSSPCGPRVTTASTTPLHAPPHGPSTVWPGAFLKSPLSEDGFHRGSPDTTHTRPPMDLVPPRIAAAAAAMAAINFSVAGSTTGAGHHTPFFGVSPSISSASNSIPQSSQFYHPYHPYWHASKHQNHHQQQNYQNNGMHNPMASQTRQRLLPPHGGSLFHSRSPRLPGNTMQHDRGAVIPSDYIGGGRLGPMDSVSASSANSIEAAAASTVAAVAAAAAMAASELTGGSLKKCRARFGLEHQNMWCKPCRRKKKCIRFLSDTDVDEFPLTSTRLPSSPNSLDNRNAHPALHPPTPHPFRHHFSHAHAPSSLRMAHLGRRGLTNSSGNSHFMDPFHAMRPSPFSPALHPQQQTSTPGPPVHGSIAAHHLYAASRFGHPPTGLPFYPPQSRSLAHPNGHASPQWRHRVPQSETVPPTHRGSDLISGFASRGLVDPTRRSDGGGVPTDPPPCCSPNQRPSFAGPALDGNSMMQQQHCRMSESPAIPDISWRNRKHSSPMDWTQSGWNMVSPKRAHHQSEDPFQASHIASRTSGLGESGVMQPTEHLDVVSFEDPLLRSDQSMETPDELNKGVAVIVKTDPLTESNQYNNLKQYAVESTEMGLDHPPRDSSLSPSSLQSASISLSASMTPPSLPIVAGTVSTSPHMVNSPSSMASTSEELLLLHHQQPPKSPLETVLNLKVPETTSVRFGVADFMVPDRLLATEDAIIDSGTADTINPGGVDETGVDRLSASSPSV